jgi:hypothetical protein
MTPEQERTQDETRAQYRFLAINIIRITGAVMLVLGLAIIARGLFGLPKVAGYALFFVGMADFMLVPLLLARRWKSPTSP